MMYLIYLFTLITTIQFSDVTPGNCSAVDVTYKGVKKGQTVYMETLTDAPGIFYVRAERDHVVTVMRCSRDGQSYAASAVTVKLDID